MSGALSIGRSLEAALRAGFSLRQAFSRVASDHPELEPLAATPSAVPMVDLIDSWGRLLPDDDMALYVGAARLQLEDHGNLADKFGLLSRILERR